MTAGLPGPPRREPLPQRAQLGQLLEQDAAAARACAGGGVCGLRHIRDIANADGALRGGDHLAREQVTAHLATVRRVKRCA